MEEELQSQKNSNKTLIAVIISVVITAIIVGVGVYYWQQFSIRTLKYGFARDKGNLAVTITDLKNENDNLSAVAEANHSDSGGFIGEQPPYCVRNGNSYDSEISQEEVIKKLSQYYPDSAILVRALFDNEEFKELLNDTKLYTICNYGGIYTTGLLSFVLWGDLVENEIRPYVNHNIIGIFDGVNEPVYDYQSLPKSGDIVMCQIVGRIGKNILYSCGGGDGPCAWGKIYLLKAEEGASEVVKDCSICEGVTSCKVDKLNLD